MIPYALQTRQKQSDAHETTLDIVTSPVVMPR